MKSKAKYVVHITIQERELLLAHMDPSEKEIVGRRSNGRASSRELPAWRDPSDVLLEPHEIPALE